MRQCAPVVASRRGGCRSPPAASGRRTRRGAGRRSRPAPRRGVTELRAPTPSRATGSPRTPGRRDRGRRRARVAVVADTPRYSNAPRASGRPGGQFSNGRPSKSVIPRPFAMLRAAARYETESGDTPTPFRLDANASAAATRLSSATTTRSRRALLPDCVAGPSPPATGRLYAPSRADCPFCRGARRRGVRGGRRAGRCRADSAPRGRPACRRGSRRRRGPPRTRRPRSRTRGAPAPTRGTTA